MPAAKNVWVDGCWYGPSYPDAGDPPKGSVDERMLTALGNAGAALDLLGQRQDAQAADQPPASKPAPMGAAPPPKAGPGSSAKAWRNYAAAHGVEVAEDASREDVIAACERQGVRTDN